MVLILSLVLIYPRIACSLLLYSADGLLYETGTDRDTLGADTRTVQAERCELAGVLPPGRALGPSRVSSAL